MPLPRSTVDREQSLACPPAPRGQATASPVDRVGPLGSPPPRRSQWTSRSGLPSAAARHQSCSQPQAPPARPVPATSRPHPRHRPDNTRRQEPPRSILGSTAHQHRCLLLDLPVRTDGRPGDLRPSHLTAYVTQDGLLLAWSMTMRHAAHPDGARRSPPQRRRPPVHAAPAPPGLVLHALQGVVIPEGSLHISDHAEVVGSAQSPPAPVPTSLHRDSRLTMSYTPGVDVTSARTWTACRTAPTVTSPSTTSPPSEPARQESPDC